MESSKLRFAEDYNNCFNSNTYLTSYYDLSGTSAPFQYEFRAQCFHQFWSKMPLQNARILEFGGGPSIFWLISACPRAREIIFAEYCENNRKAVEAWQRKSVEAFDWTMFFKFVVQDLEGKGEQDVSLRENELRRKLTHILPCDIEKDDPIEWPITWDSQPTFDVVTTTVCLETAVTSEESYCNAIGKLRKLLQPGGYLVMAGALGETFYTVGNEKFHTFPLRKELIEKAVKREGFEKLNMQVVMNSPDPTKNPLCNSKGEYFLSAQLPRTSSEYKE